MSRRSSPSRRLRKRVNRRLYGGLFRVYRAVLPTARWTGALRPAAVRRVLVVQPYGVGDMILTTPLLSFLREQLPDAEIDVLASSRNASVLAGDPCVARVYVHDGTRLGWLRILPRLRARGYDVIFSGQAGRGLREGLTASAVARRWTYKVSLWRPKRYHGLFTAIIRVPPSVSHTADRLLYMAQRALGVEPPAATARRYPPRVATDTRAEATAEAFVAERGLTTYVVVNVSSHFASRDWDPRRCADVLKLLLERHADLTVVVTRAPGKERAAEEVAAHCASRRVLVAPAMSLLAVAALVRRSLAVVTTETSLIHIASACRRPAVVLYAPESPREVAHWLPLGVPYRALVSRRRDGMSDVPPEQVADAFDELLREAAGPAGTGTASAQR